MTRVLYPPLGSRRPPHRWLLSHMNNCATRSLSTWPAHLRSQVWPLSSRMRGLPPPVFDSTPVPTSVAVTRRADRFCTDRVGTVALSAVTPPGAVAAPWEVGPPGNCVVPSTAAP